MKRTLCALALASLSLATTTALGCGINFGLRLLAERDHSLHWLWEGDFRSEIRSLVPAPPGIRIHRFLDDKGEPVEQDRQRRVLQGRLLDTQTMELAGVVEGQKDPNQAWALGEGLDAGLRAYLAGVVAWHQTVQYPDLQPFDSVSGDDASETDPGVQFLGQAVHWFERAAQSRATEQSPWPLLGQYMLARSMAKQGKLTDAVAAFDNVRARVIAGEADPLGLAAASLSESGRALWDAGNYSQSVRRYAEHAALGDREAGESVLWLLNRHGDDESVVRALLAESPGREALILYAYTHFPVAEFPQWADSGRIEWLPRNADDDDTEEAFQEPSHWQNADGSIQLSRTGIMERILESLRDRPDLEGMGAARMAALAWRQGHFELAERYHAVAAGPLADWVGAKLAVRAGDVDAAARHFQAAAAAFAPDEEWTGRRGEALIAEPHCQLQAELAVLELSRGDIRQSLELLLSAGAVYWLDAAYLAERVLPTDDLISLVDGLGNNARVRIKQPALPLDSDEYDGYGASARLRARDVAADLRYLLARRLLREGRYDEAINRFEVPRHRADAAHYVGALRDADQATGRDKARALYQAALTVRQRGMQILGFETGPDWRVHGGNYSQLGTGELLRDKRMPERERRWISADETRAIEGQRDTLQPRYHYRLVAAQLADRAADELDTDSPAFAAVLCHATSWLLDREPDLARVYYRRYLDQTRPVSYHAEFGRSCPDVTIR